jgi:hypothetical protein
MRPLPNPVTATEEYLAAMVDRLDQLLDRTPARQDEDPAGSGAVELREPAAKPAPAKKAAPGKGGRRS